MIYGVFKRRILSVWLLAGILLSGCGGEAGLVAHKYDGNWSRLPDFSTLAPSSQHTVPDAGTHNLGVQNYGLVLKGKLDLDQTGQYRFHLRSDDGSRLLINGSVVANNDGTHTAATVSSGNIPLSSGTHELRIEYFQASGPQELSLSYQYNDGPVTAVAADMVSHNNNHKLADTGGGDGGGDDGGDDGGNDGGNDGGVTVAFIGDTGTGGNFQSVLDLIKQEGAELTIVAGDTSYSASRDDNWDSMVRTTLGNSDPAIIAAGNHDYGDSNFNDVKNYGEARLNRQSAVNCSGDYAEQMTCTYKNLYIVLSAIGSAGSRSDHENYISNRLANAPANSWRICAWHKNQRDMQAGGKSDEVGWTAYETCRQEGAIIATGHEHSYSRTHLLSDMSSQTIASTSSTFTVTEGRTFAFVSGLGGIGIRDQERSGNWWASIYTSTQGARYGAMFATFYDERADFYFKNINGQIIDSFTVMKGY